MKVTSYEDINQLIDSLSQTVSEILGDKLVGIYLFGSLSYGDFNPDTSDVDLVVVLKEALSDSELESVKILHHKINNKFPKWAERIEVSYTPLQMFSSIEPPADPRPYFGEGEYYMAEYGNEWIINNYLLYHYGITIVGPEFKTLIQPIDIKKVQQAAIKDLFKEWEPKLRNTDWLDNSHYQTYLVLNLCRILYTVLVGAAKSKKVAAEWVKKQFPEWSGLISSAENWKYGIEMTKKAEALDFLKFAIERVNEARISS